MESAQSFPLFLIPLLPLGGAAINLLIGRKLNRTVVHSIACLSVAAAALLAIHAVAGPLWELWNSWHKAGGAGPAPVINSILYTWIQSGDLTISLSFMLDPLSAVMILTVTIVGFLIHVYSVGYMAHDPRYATYFGYLNLFTGAMLTLVLGDSLPVMFIGWEGVGLCSYLLIGFWFDKEKNAHAGRKAFVVNRIGDFGFLLGIFVLYAATGSMDFAGLKESAAQLTEPLGSTGLPIAFFAGLLLFVGACGKSAQIPLYVWLPDAMAGPTPVSALIHAATMVTAGVYMVARMGFLYLAAPQALMVVSGVGALTALVAAAIGFAQTDIKKVLAYSTVSQLGFMFVGVGTGAFAAGIFHLFTHAFFKAGLFLGAGSVMHAMGDRTEIMQMGGLRRKLPWTHLSFLIYCLAIAGIFPFAGFFSKDEILLGAFTAHLDGWPAWYGKLLWVVLSVAALGTAFYMWRLYFLVFGGKCRADEETAKHAHESPPEMTVPLLVLAGGAALLGLLGMPAVFGFPNYFAEWLAPSLAGSAHHAHAGTTWTLMVIALLAGVAGIALAAFFYKDGPSTRVASLVGAIGPIHRFVSAKLYVDELYDLVVVRPFRWLATAVYNIVDRFVIDLVFVNGAAFAVDVFGRFVRLWQNGDAQRYLAAIVIGAGAMVFWVTTWPLPSPAFSMMQGDGNRYQFVADIGAGPAAAQAEIRWDFDSDGNTDAVGKDVSWAFPAAGTHKVTLIVRDPMFGSERKTVRKILVQAGTATGPRTESSAVNSARDDGDPGRLAFGALGGEVVSLNAQAGRRRVEAGLHSVGDDRERPGGAARGNDSMVAGGGLR
ncbi:MAG: NADH-quinone oxidoreductase subunit L [Pseudomonadota bacterium]